MAQELRTFRDHFLSIYQSAAAAFERQSAAENDTGLESAEAVGTDFGIIEAAADVAALRTGNRNESADALTIGLESMSAADVARTCASLGLQYLEALAVGDTATALRLKGDMPGSKCDPRWARTLESYLRYFGPLGTRQEIPYIRAANAGTAVIRIKPNTRIGIIGDWGTGAEPARAVLRQVKERKPDIVVHLGDIYYSGTPEECRVNFEAIVNDVLERPQTGTLVYTLAGNHDMYSGGEGYYDLINRLNPPAARQPASFFCLRTEDDSWQIVAIDTGLHDYSPFAVSSAVTFLEADEEAWLEARVKEFPGKTILMSHHPLFSAFSAIGKKDASGRWHSCNPRLKSVFDRIQSSGRQISAWYWGHEHNLCIYEPYAGLQRGRCIGHSAIPVFMKDRPYEVLDDLNDAPRIIANAKLSTAGEMFTRGFGILSLNSNGSAEAEYFENRNGNAARVHNETID